MWVCIQSATTGYKRAPKLILPNYDTLRINLFWMDSQAVVTDVFFFNRVTNSYLDKRIPLENDKSIIYSDYEVVVVCNSVSGRSVRTVIETNKFSFFIFGIIYIYVFYIIYSSICIQGVTFIWEMILHGKPTSHMTISIKCMKFILNTKFREN